MDFSVSVRTTIPAGHIEDDAFTDGMLDRLTGWGGCLSAPHDGTVAVRLTVPADGLGDAVDEATSIVLALARDWHPAAGVVSVDTMLADELGRELTAAGWPV